jgi:hypothetical protein
LSNSPSALTQEGWLAAPRRKSIVRRSTAEGPKLEEIDDVLALLHKAPPKVSLPTTTHQHLKGREVEAMHDLRSFDADVDIMLGRLGSQLLQ